MAVTWRDRAANLRRFWRMPNTVNAELALITETVKVLRAELDALRAGQIRASGAVDALRVAQETATERHRADVYRTIEGAAAAALQLIAPRLDALGAKLEESVTARAAADEALQRLVAQAVEAQVQPRHAHLSDLVAQSIHRGEEAGALGRGLTDAAADLRRRLDDSQDAAERRLRRLEDLGFDLLALARPAAGIGSRLPRLSIRTDHPVAAGSADHLQPRGAANDDTRHPRFVAACERCFQHRPIRHLDLGCAGAGLVWDFLLAGHASYGIEGSDFPLRSRRAYWRVVPENLFTADITQPFDLLESEGRGQVFDAITAWEVLEHIPEPLVEGLFGNVARLLAPGGLFLASVATFRDEDAETGAVWHATIRPAEWWLERAAAHGLYPAARRDRFDVADFPRGSGNPRAHDWDVRRNPELGFHLVLEASEQ